MVFVEVGDQELIGASRLLQQRAQSRLPDLAGQARVHERSLALADEVDVVALGKAEDLTRHVRHAHTRRELHRRGHESAAGAFAQEGEPSG